VRLGHRDDPEAESGHLARQVALHHRAQILDLAQGPLAGEDQLELDDAPRAGRAGVQDAGPERMSASPVISPTCRPARRAS
jgi:hypothetical protein